MGTAVSEKTAKPPKATKAGRPKSNVPKPRMAQMNVRIEADVKKQGDRAFERIGLTPSEVVRALWRYASGHAAEPEAMRQLMAELESGSTEYAEDEREQQRTLLEEGWALIDKFREEHGLVCTVPDDVDERMAYYDQLREEAYWERLAERGLA